MRRLIAVLFVVVCIYPVFADIKSPDNKADFIVIYHEALKSQVEKYIHWRKSKDVDVFSVSTNEIFTAFEDDTSSEAESIRNFVSYALSNWEKPSPKYVLLCGGINYIPPYKEQSEFHENEIHNEDSIILDHFYSVNINEDNLIPDIAIGRLPARTPEELQIMFDKIVQFEEIKNSDYEIDVLNVTDSRDSNSFESASENIINNYYPQNLNVKRAYFSDDSPFNIGISEFHSTLSKPIKYLNYFGHGQPQQWSHLKILSTEHIDTLNFAKEPFIMLALACSQNFDDPDVQGLAESLLTVKNGGAIAAIGSSGVNFFTTVNKFGMEFYENLFSKNEIRLGDIIHKIKSKHYSDFFRRFTLLGDPYMVVRNDFTADVSASVANDEFYYAHPNPTSLKTTIELEIVDPSEIKICVYDLSGKKVSDIFSGFLHQGIHSFEWSGDTKKSGLYFCKIEKMGISSVLPLVLEK